MFTRYWTGFLSIFNSPHDLGDNKKCKTHKEFEGGIACAKFVSNSKVIYNSNLTSYENLKQGTENLVSW